MNVKEPTAEEIREALEWAADRANQEADAIYFMIRHQPTRGLESCARKLNRYAFILRDLAWQCYRKQQEGGAK